MAVSVSGDRARRGARAALSLLLGLLLPACALMPDGGARRATEAALAAKAGFQPMVFDTGRFVLHGDLRVSGAGAGDPPVLMVYIEGDGYAWVTRTRTSSDPTPRTAVGLELAAADPAPLVLYLGRPCQYVTPAEARGCGPDYWSERRFAPEVIEAINRAIDQAERRVGAERVVLVGYSGGGVVAALAAARRNDVAAWATVAAPMDLVAWTEWHRVSPLSGSLNPMDDAPSLARLPQIHFVGASDTVVPTVIVQGFLEREGPGRDKLLVVVPDADHYCCWAQRWPALRPLIPQS